MSHILTEDDAVEFIRTKIEKHRPITMRHTDICDLYMAAIPLFTSDVMFKNGVNHYLADVFLKHTKLKFEWVFTILDPVELESAEELINADLNIHQFFMLCRFRGESTEKNFKSEFLAKTNCEQRKVPCYLEWCARHKSFPYDLKLEMFNRTKSDVYLPKQANELFMF